MGNIYAIFVKQALDIFKNRLVLIQFAVFPVVALVMTEFVAKADANIPNNMFVTLFATIYAGMTLVTTTASAISEDRENKSLRLLVMAGVRPHQYLLGMSLTLVLASLLVSIVFALIGSFGLSTALTFIGYMLLASGASILLGSVIGMLCNNQQAATAISMPLSMVLGFSPMVTMFNERARQVLGVFYTQQLSELVNGTSTDVTQSVFIILANIAVLLIAFVIAYRIRGLRN
ncbi:MAG: ABC transporter permease [Coriobacteriia bacterium]|nr:ABC transporter permease [Coriobacteriia bacterium]